MAVVKKDSRTIPRGAQDHPQALQKDVTGAVLQLQQQLHCTFSWMDPGIEE